MNVAVYSGSFNPLHEGHVQVARYLLEEGGFDRIYLVVSPHNPFKDKELSCSAHERYKAACDAVLKLGLDGRIIVDDIELGMEGPSYTIRTLDALKEREPDNDFTLAFGADILCEFTGWKQWRRILSEYGIVVYPRGDVDMQGEVAALLDAAGNESDGMKIRLLENAPKINISSTQIREGRRVACDGGL